MLKSYWVDDDIEEMTVRRYRTGYLEIVAMWSYLTLQALFCAAGVMSVLFTLGYAAGLIK